MTGQGVEVLDVISCVALIGGGFFSVVGAIGIVRLPDFFARLHGGGITDTLGAGLILIGLMFQADHWLPLAKLIMILVLLLMTSPTGCHALANSALLQGLKPKVGDAPHAGSGAEETGR